MATNQQLMASGVSKKIALSNRDLCILLDFPPTDSWFSLLFIPLCLSTFHFASFFFFFFKWIHFVFPLELKFYSWILCACLKLFISTFSKKNILSIKLEICNLFSQAFKDIIIMFSFFIVVLKGHLFESNMFYVFFQLWSFQPYLLQMLLFPDFLPFFYNSN